MSRYGNAKSTFDKKEDTSISASEVPGVVKSLRDNFDKDMTRSFESRVRNLRNFQTMILEGRQDLCAAMKVVGDPLFHPVPLLTDLPTVFRRLICTRVHSKAMSPNCRLLKAKFMWRSSILMNG